MFPSNPVPDQGQSIPSEELDQDKPSEQDAKQQPEKPAYLTRDEFEAILEARETAFMNRVQQSARDRQKIITTQLDEMKQLLSNSKVPVTPEMEATMRQQIEQRLDGSSQPQAQAQQPGPQDTAAQFIYSETQAIFKDEGLVVSQNDPEWKIIQSALDDRNGNLTKYRKAVLRAVDSKREREQSQEEDADARVSTPSGKRSSSNDISNINDSDKLYEMGEERIRRGQRK